jgi:hypothetical protein
MKNITVAFQGQMLQIVIGDIGIVGAVKAVICETPWSFELSLSATPLLLP